MKVSCVRSLHWTIAAASAAAIFLGCGDDEKGISADEVIDGLKILSRFSEIEQGSSLCPFGGQRVDYGIDKNKDGALSADEITNTSYLCSSSGGGQPGAVIIQRLSEPPGANCEHGGARVIIGFDTDGSGALSEDEIKQTDYVCAANSGEVDVSKLGILTPTYTEPAGQNCEFGGIRIDIGLDADKNGSLSKEEITATRYSCFDEKDSLRLASAEAYREALLNYVSRAFIVFAAISSSDAIHNKMMRFCGLTNESLDYSLRNHSVETEGVWFHFKTIPWIAEPALVAEEILAGRLLFDEQSFRRDYAFLDNSFMLCSDETRAALAAFKPKVADEVIEAMSAKTQLDEARVADILGAVSLLMTKDYLTGNVGQSENCFSDRECAGENAYCANVGYSPTVWDLDDSSFQTQYGCGMGFCTTGKKWNNANCFRNAECQSGFCSLGLLGTGYCQDPEVSPAPPLSLGDVCTGTGSCAQELTCAKPNGASEKRCVAVRRYAGSGEACGHTEENTYVRCTEGFRCVAEGGGADIAFGAGEDDDLPAAAGVCAPTGKGIGESCCSSEECANGGDRHITACMGPNRQALPAESEGTCQYLGDVGDSCSLGDDPYQKVCRHSLVCRNGTGVCETLPVSGGVIGQFPWCDPVQSWVYYNDDLEPSGCRPYLDNGKSPDYDAIAPGLYDEDQCKSEYLSMGTCQENPYFWTHLSDRNRALALSGCDLARLLTKR